MRMLILRIGAMRMLNLEGELERAFASGLGALVRSGEPGNVMPRRAQHVPDGYARQLKP